jgi:hypothetical protein
MKELINKLLTANLEALVFTYSFIVAPIRVLDPGKDMRFGLGDGKPCMDDRCRKRMA